MKTYIQPGRSITMVAPTGGVTAGTPLLIGLLVVIPLVTAAEAASFEGQICGVHSVTKADSQAWTQNAKVYWDDTAKNFTTTASGNTAAGFAAAPVAATGGLTTGTVLLNGLPG